MDKNILVLQELGFSEHDALVYLALVDLKTVTANPLISRTSLHRSIVYTSLEHLVGRKLVEVKEVKGKKTFTAVSPSLLVEEFTEKSRLAEEVSALIAQKMQQEKQEITIHEGNDEYLALLASTLRELPKDSVKFVLGTGGAEFMEQTMLPIWKRYHRIAHERRIKIKMIGYGNQKEAIKPYTDKEGIYEVKYLPAEMENPAGIHIYPELGIVLNIIYSTRTTPITAIRIKNKAFVDSYLNLFKNLWDKQ